MMESRARMLYARQEDDEMIAFDKEKPFKWTACEAIAAQVSADNSKSQWNREIFQEAHVVLSGASQLLEPADVVKMLSKFLSAFQTYRQLDHDIESLLYGGIKGSTRVRSLLIPLCSSLIEGCYSNLARALMIPLSRISGKNYESQKDLQPLMDALGPNGFLKLSKIPNVGLRNAMSHGGIMVKEGTAECRVEYTYTRGKNRFREEMSSGDLERIALMYLDAISGLILAFCNFFDEIDALSHVLDIEDEYVRLMYIGFGISDDECICLDAFKAPINSQISYAFSTQQIETEILFGKAETLLANLRIACPDFENYAITFSHPRIPGNFLRAKKPDIDAFIKRGSPQGWLIQTIIDSGDILWLEANTEEINELEAEYYRFPIKNTNELKIYDVSDASLNDRKRLKANVFIGDVDEKDKIIDLALEAIEWVRGLYNPPNMSMPIVHGNMAADCVYLNIYKTIHERDRSLLQNNDNFVCTVEFCIKDSFRLADNNQFTRYLYSNSEWLDENIRFLWRQKKYLPKTSNAKVGRNDLCPCGSGKKYKKCHG